MTKISSHLLCLLLAGAASAREVTVSSDPSTMVAIASDRLALRFDLAKGTYEAISE